MNYTAFSNIVFEIWLSYLTSNSGCAICFCFVVFCLVCLFFVFVFILFRCCWCFLFVLFWFWDVCHWSLGNISSCVCCKLPDYLLHSTFSLHNHLYNVPTFYFVSNTLITGKTSGHVYKYYNTKQISTEYRDKIPTWAPEKKSSIIDYYKCTSPKIITLERVVFVP